MVSASNNVNIKVTYQGIDQTQRASAKARKAIKGVGTASKSAAKGLGGMQGATAGIGAALGKVAGPMMGVAGAFAAIGAAREAVRVATEFSASMGKLATLLPGANERLLRLKDNITSIATGTGADLNDVAEGAFQVVSAFGDAADTTQKLSIVTKAAAAGGSSVAEALALASAVTKAYGDTSADAVQHAVDLAFMTNKLGQTTFPELAGSIGRVTPLAKALGVSQEELFGVFATLTGVTGDAAAVSTQMASAMGAMLKESTGASKAIKEMGFVSAKALIAEKGLVGAFQAITQHGGASAEAIQKLFKRKEAMLAVLPLISSQADVAAEKIGKMGEASGAADEAFRAGATGAGAMARETKILAARSEAASVAIGGLLAPAIQTATKAWVIFKEGMDPRRIAAAIAEYRKLNNAAMNDMVRRNMSESERMEADAKTTMDRMASEWPAAWKRIQASFSGGAREVSNAWATASAQGRKAQAALSAFAKKSAKGVSAFVRKIRDRDRKNRIARARAAGRKRHAMLVKQEKEFSADLEKIRAADAQRAVDQRVEEGRALIEASAQSKQAQSDALAMLIEAEIDDDKRAALERIQIASDAAAHVKRIDENLYLSKRDRAIAITAIRKSEAAKLAEINQRAADKWTANMADVSSQLLSLQAQVGNTGSAVGNVMSALPAMAASVSTAFSNSKTAMKDALAVGQSAFVGLAAAEAKRSLDGIDNAKRLELATAKTEKERANITRKYEERRAKIVETAERRKAAILAIMEAAKAVASYPNVPQMAAHGAAAVLFGAIAGGALGGAGAGGGGGVSVGAATGGGGAMATTTADAAPSTSAPVVVNFGAGFVFGTHQQVGKSVAGSLKSLRTTGLATAGGV